jgi:hypothetical protein
MERLPDEMLERVAGGLQKAVGKKVLQEGFGQLK